MYVKILWLKLSYNKKNLIKITKYYFSLIRLAKTLKFVNTLCKHEVDSLIHCW